MNAYIHTHRRSAALIFAVCLALCGRAYAAILPDSIVYIESGAFQGDDSLTSVCIPESVASVGAEAFADCSNLYQIEVHNPSAVLSANSLGRKGETRLIRANYGSTAKTYASQYGFEFRYLQEEVSRPLAWAAAKVQAGATYSQYDCIGFVRASYSNALGIYVAQTCPAMFSYSNGLRLSKSQIKEMQPGDIICFTDDKYWKKTDFNNFTNPKYCTHVGMYVGAGYVNGVYYSGGVFVESSQGAGKTRFNVILLNSSSHYYNRNFMGAIRILY